MPPTQHSKFSASGSARLLACPGSYELGIRADDGTRRSTVYSAQGTLAHAISETCVQTGKDVADFIGQTRSADGFDFTVDEAFAEAAQVYVDYVRGLRALGFAVMLEQTVSPAIQWEGELPALEVDLFGTGDCIAYNPDTRELVIGDLKFGAGVPVEAEGNTQLSYYGAGAAHPDVLRPLCDALGVPFNGVDKVTLTIIQPRAFHKDGPIRRWSLSMDDLTKWAKEVLYPGVRKALDDKGQTLAPGTWCRFCPVLAHCSEPAELSFETARAAFVDAPLENIPAPTDPGAALPDVHLSDEKLAELLDKVAIIEPWLAALKELGHARATAGRELKGWKLVPKRALRRWAGDADETIKNLTDAGLDPDKFTVTKPLTPAQVERAVGKKQYAALVAPHVVKSSSGTTLAVEGDPRSRIQRRSAEAAFATTTKTTTQGD